MSMCEACSDRMPAVASGQSEWLPAEWEHLQGCRDCMAEWELVSAAAALGRSVTADAATLIPQLLERLRIAGREERRRQWVRRSVQVAGLAAAAVLLLMIVPRRRGVELVQPVPGPVLETAAGLQLAELDGAAPAELEAVLSEFDEPAMPGSSLDGPDVEGLDVPLMERALRSWEES